MRDCVTNVFQWTTSHKQPRFMCIAGVRCIEGYANNVIAKIGVLVGFRCVVDGPRTRLRRLFTSGSFRRPLDLPSSAVRP